MVNFVGISSSASWVSEVCPYTLPTRYRPKLEIRSALVTDNGSSITSLICVTAEGVVKIENRGANGTTEKRNGFICFPI